MDSKCSLIKFIITVAAISTTALRISVASPTAAGRPYPTLPHGTVPLFAPWVQLLLTAEGQIPEFCGRQCGELGLRAVASVIDG